MNNQNFTPANVLRVAQILVLAMVAGVLVFGVITLVVGAGFQPMQDEAIISLAMVLFAITAVLARLFVPSLVTRTSCQQIVDRSGAAGMPGSGEPVVDDNQLAALFLKEKIIANALLEGACFALLVAFMLEGQAYTLGLAVLLVIGLAAGFPTQSSLDNWLQDKRRMLRDMQM
jgi:hypothetical protein